MRNRLNPSINLVENTKIYNTFFHDDAYKNEALEYLSSLYAEAINHPLKFNELMEDMSKLSDEKLIYLIVEIKKMLKEKNCLGFNGRESGCLLAYFNALSFAFENMDNLKLNANFIKKLHGICTDVNNVEMDGITKENSGDYRNNDREILDLSIANLSVDGLLHLIELIDKELIPSLTISLTNDAFDLNDHQQKLAAYEYANAIINYALYKFNPVKEEYDDILLSNVNQFLHETIEFFKRYKNFSEEEILKFLEVNQFYERIISDLNENIKNLELLQNNSDDNQQKKRLKKILSSLKNYRDELSNSTSLHSVIKSIYHIKRTGLDELFTNIVSENKQRFLEDDKKSWDFELSMIKSETLPFVLEKYHVSTNQELAKILYQQISNSALRNLRIEFASLDEIDELMDQFINDFNANVGNLHDKTDDEKLYFIFKHIQFFLLIHPFFDGNNRVFVNVLANRLLIQHGFPPAVYFNPFVIYAHSLSEIVEAVKLSCANFLAMVKSEKDGINPYFDFSQKNLTDDDFKELANFTSPLKKFFEKRAVKECVNYIQLALQSFFINLPSEKATLFQPRTTRYSLFENDLAKFKVCKNNNEILEYLNSCVKSYEEQGYFDIASQYNELVYELKPKSIRMEN